MQSGALAVYTTVYPGVERFLAPWYRSLQGQSEQAFDLWIGVDELEQAEVIDAMGAEPSASWIMANDGETPAEIRNKAILALVQDYEMIVFADADDLMEPDRVAAGKASLEDADLSACAMRLVDHRAEDLGRVFAPPLEADLETLLPRSNLFGLGNSTYRADALRIGLPIPADCAIVDWFLATKAWLAGARLGFDHGSRVAYRQHGHNLAQVLPPFSEEQIIRSTVMVLNHYACVLGSVKGEDPAKRRQLQEARDRAMAFQERMTSSSETLARYIEELNRLTKVHLWWECVAHPDLEGTWNVN